MWDGETLNQGRYSRDVEEMVEGRLSLDEGSWASVAWKGRVGR